MTPEERERLNNLCKRIEDEQNPKVFNALVEELNELLGATPEPPAEGKKPLSDPPRHDANARNPPLRLLQVRERISHNENACAGMASVRELRSQCDAAGP